MVITLIERDDGRVLLDPDVNFPMPMYSLLAGFVEPGETLEQAIGREILEEVGVLVDRITYWGSQPWPFPHSLMIGFTARYVSGDLVLQPDEIADAGWFGPDDLPMRLPAMSIAGRIIADWVARRPRPTLPCCCTSRPRRTGGWRFGAGTVVPRSLVVGEFIRLSTPDQVALPANRLYPGRDDLLLLVVDPARLADDVRWEPGVPSDPSSMRFPHLYGPLPVAAVTSRRYPGHPTPEGVFHPPTGLPDPVTDASRAGPGLRPEPGLATEAAATVPLTRRLRSASNPGSRTRGSTTRAGCSGPVPVGEIVVADADRVLGGAGCAPTVGVDDPARRRRAGLDRRWAITEERIMVLAPEVELPGPVQYGVRAVTSEAMHELWAAGLASGPARRLRTRSWPSCSGARSWPTSSCGSSTSRRSTPYRAGIVAGAQLRIDGATAVLEVGAGPIRTSLRSRAMPPAVVGEAIRRAHAAGCDLVWLIAIADDWPRHWYTHLGFEGVGGRWSAVLPGAS